MARKAPHNLMTSGRTVADKAMDTLSDLASTVENAAGRTQSAAQDAQNTLANARKSAKTSGRKARKNAQRSMKDARKTMTSVRDETTRRTHATRDAIAGRRPRRRWPMMIGIVGVGIGAVVGAASARLSGRSATLNHPEADLSDITATPPTGTPAATYVANGRTDQPAGETTTDLPTTVGVPVADDRMPSTPEPVGPSVTAPRPVRATTVPKPKTDKVNGTS